MSDNENKLDTAPDGERALNLDADEVTAAPLDDADRRALLAKLARVGAAALPVSMVLLDDAKAMNNTGSSPEFGGG
ncbi:MAG: hypothetical protein AAF141_15380 [Pseudomonadota bacterium]